MNAPQDYASHRMLPLGYIACGVAILMYAAYQVWQATTAPSCGAGLAAAAGLALVVVWFNARRKAQIMQDRIIRLEMQVRLRLILPPERHPEIARLELAQLVGLRFASDAELPELVRRTLAGELATQDAIKRAVREWQPDHLRV
jgi:hypothetical protein